MAQRRMFTLAVVDTDRFNDMPMSARLLYYELGMRADDDGFVSSPKKIVKMTGCTEDDLRVLMAKGFVICFDSGVLVITEWKLHNYIPSDRYHKTIYQDEAKQLTIENNVYMLTAVSNSDTTCIQPVYKMDTEDRLGKDRIGKDRLGKDKDTLSTSVDAPPRFDYQAVVDLFNAACVSLPRVQKLNDKRRRAIKNASKLLGEISFEELFARVEKSDFLTGRTGKWSGCGFDWILQPSNLTKILEGNYSNKQTAATITEPRNYNEVF